MSQDPRDIDPDDFFQDTRMSFGDHIEDLRKHLWRAVKGFFVALIFGFAIGRQVLMFIAKPVEDQLKVFYDKRMKDTLEKRKQGNDDEIRKADARSDYIQVAFSREQFR